MRSCTWVLLWLLAAGCGGNGTGRSASPADVPPRPPPEIPTGDPISGLAQGTWTWVPFPESRCDDGTATGLGVNPAPGPDLVVYLDGGGACWDHLTCVVQGTSRHGPWAREHFEARAPSFAGTLFDRGDPANPFRDWSFVFVPYCTGDVHSGDRATSYSSGASSRTLQHRGRANVLAFASRIAATFPAPRRLVIAGSSAGGYGSLVNYDTLRRRWPGAQGFLVDDAGPAIRGLPSAAERDAWWAAWGTPDVLATFCAACAADVSRGWEAVSRRWPADRIAFLSSLRDATMRGYLLAPAASFEQAIQETAAAVWDPLPNVRYFLVPGESHTMLNAPSEFTASGTPLREWLRQMVDGDPAWASRRP